MPGQKSRRAAPKAAAAEPPLDAASEQPLYLQLADRLAHAIASGRYAPGARLPTESALMAAHGISRITVRQALARLVRNAQVVTRRGKGSFVARPALQQHLGRLQGFHDALLAQGADPRTELLEWSASAGGSDLALPAGLDLPVRLRRRYDLDERPFAVVEAYLPAAAAPLGAERARRLTVYEILREFLGVEIERADVAIRCCRPSAAVRRELGLAAAQPVLLMERSSFDAAGRTCEFMRISILPERYTFRMSLAGPIEIARGLERARAAPAARNPVPRTHKA